MVKKLLAIFVLTVLTQSAFSQTIDKAMLDGYFEALEVNNKFMGSIALSQNGKLIYTKQTGFADIENSIRPNQNTRYRIGSISKTFTTVLVFKAIEENKIKLSDKIDKYFPTIKNSNKITISNLLNHRSGIHNFTELEDYRKWNTEKKSEKELVSIVEKSGSDFEPDTKAEYSNSNFLLLSFILQKIYKKEYAQILNEKIIVPIGLKNTYFGKPINIKDNESYSYSFVGKWVKEPETDMSIPLGAGAIVSTPGDLTEFADALFSGKLVSKQSLELMKTLKDNYGMGLSRVPFDGHYGYGHLGRIDGFSSALYHFSDQNISMAFISNGTNYENNNIALALLNVIYYNYYEIPKFETIDVSSEELDQYLGVYASKQIALKIAITKDGNTLIAQATGQSSFPLEATEKDKFKFEKAGIVLEFKPTDNTMVLKQGGGTFNFIRE